MSDPISIRASGRNPVAIVDSFSSSQDALAASAPIDISNPLARRPLDLLENPDTYFSSILESPSISKGARYGFNTVDAGKERFRDMYHASKCSLTGHSAAVKKELNYSAIKRQDNTGKASQASKQSIKDTSFVNRTRSASLANQRNMPSAPQAVAIGRPVPETVHSSVPIPFGGSIGGMPASIHPSIGKVGLFIVKGVLSGSNARCIAMLEAFKDIIRDYVTPNHSSLNRTLDAHLKPMINHLVLCRPLSVSMGNAIRHLKFEISNLSHELTEAESKEQLFASIDSYIRERIHLADKLISGLVCTKIKNGDVIMVFSRSSVVIEALLAARKQKIDFRVIVVDSRPCLEGRVTAQLLSAANIPITYIFITAIGCIIQQVTKILIGAHCIFSNGTLLGKLGTSLIAMTGYDHHIPVIACCETYKFTDKVQLETAAFEEEANPMHLVIPIEKGFSQSPASFATKSSKDNVKPSSKGKAQPKVPTSLSGSKLSYFNVVHDITPSKYVNVVITEIGLIPCTSIPVVLREYRPFNSIAV